MKSCPRNVYSLVQMTEMQINSYNTLTTVNVTVLDLNYEPY